MTHDTNVVREAINCGGGIINTWSLEMPISYVEHIRFEAVCDVSVAEPDDYEDEYDTDAVEIIVTYPVMKCWGRGIGLKRGAKHA